MTCPARTGPGSMTWRRHTRVGARTLSIEAGSPWVSGYIKSTYRKQFHCELIGGVIALSGKYNLRQYYPVP